MWYPGAVAPKYLDGKMAGDFGFDPLRLGANSSLLPYYREAELMNGRYAMLGVFGAIASELIFPEFKWWEAGAQDYGFDLKTLLIIQVPTMAYLEAKRWEGFQDTGACGVLNSFPFDPYGFTKDDPEINEKEIQNARAGMLAWVGICSQAANRGVGPIECLRMHVADPGNVNLFTSNVGLECTFAVVALSLAPFFVLAKQTLGDGEEEEFRPIPFEF